jgi:hypothetical protein
MIPSSAQFQYGAVLHRSSDGVWRGHADNVPPPGHHPGLVGAQPRIELAAGELRLERTAADRASSPPLRPVPRPPVQSASLTVGPLADVLRDGDRPVVWRAPTADLAVTLVRDRDPIAGFGAVTGRFAPEIGSVEDPRVFEERLYYVKRLLADRETTFVWLHVADPGLDDLVERLPDIATGGRLAVAIAGGDAGARRRLNQRITDPRRRRPKVSSAAFFDVDSRFDSEAQWRAYVCSLPSRRPDDVFVRFTIDGIDLDLREGDYREHLPWQLHVRTVHRQGVPGELSQVAIVQASLGLTREAIVDVTARIASRRITLRP